jgi:predicted NBD/HSP70 family sugar kinase
VWVAGIDIGGTTTEAVVTGPDGVVGAARIPTAPGPDGVVATALRALDEACGPTRSLGRLTALGVGIPGVVNPSTMDVAHAVNLGLVDTMPLGRIIEQAARMPVTIENDVDAATVGASRASGQDDLAYLSVGTGLAAGFFLDGRLRRGRRGATGEIGHLPFGSRTDVCPCGQRGCLELYGSGGALERDWPTGGGPAPAALLRAARQGDRRATELFQQFVEALAWAIRTVVLTSGVSHVLVGGGVATLGEELLGPVRTTLGHWANESAFLRRTGLASAVHPAPNGPLGALGAAWLAAGLTQVRTREVG